MFSPYVVFPSFWGLILLLLHFSPRAGSASSEVTQTEAATVFEEFAKGGMYKISFLKAVAWHPTYHSSDGLIANKKGG